ncbi:MAG: class I SAM-dependent methyltransferase [Fimbriimonadaceae bacterium]|nr:class I SAM-dependent methyltransferase [Fimbriimonadaceae bacterium]
MADPRTQFGRSAGQYLTSSVHGNKSALDDMVNAVRPKGGIVVDVGCGAGHTAFAFAHKVGTVIATDITPEMLEVTALAAIDRGYTNIRTEHAWAEELPFEKSSVDGVTCRLAAHHFRSIQAFVIESYRILKPGGWLAIVDNFGIDDPQADLALQNIEKTRDPSHGRSLKIGEWNMMIQRAGFSLRSSTPTWKPIPFDSWVQRMHVEPETAASLEKQMRESEGPLREYLQPTDGPDGFFFHLGELQIVADKP